MRDGRKTRKPVGIVSLYCFYRPYEGWKAVPISGIGGRKRKSFYRPYEGWKAGRKNSCPGNGNGISFLSSL